MRAIHQSPLDPREREEEIEREERERKRGEEYDR
jgi:hypothetical protein